jgi:membrane protein DedA with SNARE-associated domain
MMRRMPPVRHRLSDKQALGLLGAYLIFRAVTQRIGLALLPTLLRRGLPWVIPLLHNAGLTMIATGTKIRAEPTMLAATGAASVLQAMVAGLILYWAGWRFGPRLAEVSQASGSVWKSVWNPQQVLRAHRWLDRWGVLTVIVARGVIEWMLVPVLLVAGSSRMHKAKFVSSYFAGSVVFAALTLWVGGVAGNEWPWLPKRIESLSRWTLIIGLGLLALFIVAALAGNRLVPPKDEAASQASSENAPPTA